jgi:flagellin
MQIQVEVSQLIDEVDRIASHAQFNGMNLLTGRFAQQIGGNNPSASMWFHIGANMDQREQAFIGTMTSEALGLKDIGSKKIMDLTTANDSNMSIGLLDEALKAISKQRADLGAYQNRLEHAASGLAVGAENIQAAESRIRDANMAEEMVTFTRDSILLQSATAILAQANAKTQSVLQLMA